MVASQLQLRESPGRIGWELCVVVGREYGKWTGLMLPQNPLHLPLIQPFTHTFMHQEGLLPCRPIGSNSGLRLECWLIKMNEASGSVLALIGRWSSLSLLVRCCPKMTQVLKSSDVSKFLIPWREQN